MSKSDVVVIGNGLAGLVSALVSADQGKKVTLLSYGAGTFPLNSGLIDVLGYDDAGKTVKNPIEAIACVADEHAVTVAKLAPLKPVFIDTVPAAIFEIIIGI